MCIYSFKCAYKFSFYGPWQTPHFVFRASLLWLSVLLTRHEIWQTCTCLQGKESLGKRGIKRRSVSALVQPWSGAWWSLSLLKHDHNLLISVRPALPAKIWTRPPPYHPRWSTLNLLSPPINLHLPHSPTSPPVHSPCPFFHNVAPCSLNVNHISVSFIRHCAPLMLSEHCQHHQAQLFLHGDSEVARDAALFSTTPNIHRTVELTSADTLHAWLIFWGFKSIIVQMCNTSSCMGMNFASP